MGKSIRWIVWSRGVVQLVSLLATVIVARLLSPADYGVIALVSLCIGTSAMLTELGLGAAIVQFRDLSERELNACFWLNVVATAIAFGVITWWSPAISQWFGSPQFADVLSVALLVLPIASLRAVPDGLLRRQLRLDYVSKAEMAASLMALPVVFALALLGAGVWALVAGMFITASVQTATSFFFARWHPGLRIGGRLSQIIIYSINALGARACWLLYDQADTFVVGKVSGSISLGLYSLAKQVGTIPAEKVAGVVNQLAGPLMAELQSQRDALRVSLLRGLQAVSWLTIPVSVAVVISADDLVHVILSEKWASAVPLFRLFGVYGAIRSLAVLFPPVLMARYRMRFLFIYNLALLAVMPLAFSGAALTAGPTGVACVWLLVYPAVMVWMAREALREAGASFAAALRTLTAPVVGSLCITVAMAGTRWLIEQWRPELTGVRLVATGIIGLAVFLGGVRTLGGSARADLHDIFRRLLPRRDVSVRLRAASVS
jgi:O-antigen/teichoic acid export membrane protein